MHLLVAFLALLQAPAKPPVYRGPIDLQVPIGGLEKGRYEMEVSRATGDYVLTFSQGDQKKLTLKGHIQRPEDETPKDRVAVMGAHFLRSSEDPLPTGQERQFSQTGAAQYEEEKREWKAVMRIYKSALGGNAWFVFQERGKGGAWTTVLFKP
jgi:hypothetical protein